MEESLAKVIHDEACWLLENLGVGVEHENILDTFASTGLTVYDPVTKRVHIYKSLVKACIESVPKKDKFPVGNNSFGGGGVAAYLKRGDDYIQPVTRIHVADMMNMAEEFGIPFMFKGASQLFDWQEEEHQLKYMRRDYSGLLYVRAESQTGLDKCRRDYDDTGKLCTTHSILCSPLKINGTGANISAFYAAAERGLPLYLTTMPLSCVTGPATIYGMAVLAYAEFLVGLCLAQALNPGIQVVNGAYPAISNVAKKYCPALGSVSHNLVNYLVARVSEVFDLPSIQSGNTITGEHHNPVKGGTDPETERGFRFWNTVKDWHQVRHSFGFINCLIAYDLDKMRRDLVALDRIKQERETFDVNYDDIWYDNEACYAIVEGVERGNSFKDLDHTVRNIGILDEAYNGEGVEA